MGSPPETFSGTQGSPEEPRHPFRIVPETLPQYTGVSGDVGEKYFQLTSWIEEESCQNIRPTFYHELVTWASLDMEEQCLKPSGDPEAGLPR